MIKIGTKIHTGNTKPGSERSTNEIQKLYRIFKGNKADSQSRNVKFTSDNNMSCVENENIALKDKAFRFDREYYKKFKTKIDDRWDGENSLFSNDDMCCAEIVVGKIFKSAQGGAGDGKAPLPIIMFCQKFTLFRDATREKFDAEGLRDYYDETQNAFFEYLEKENSNMIVYTEEDVRDLKNEEIWDKLERFVRIKQNIHFKKLIYSSSKPHFMVAGDSFRYETSEEAKTAICGKDEDLSKYLRNSSAFLDSISEPLFL